MGGTKESRDASANEKVSSDALTLRHPINKSPSSSAGNSEVINGEIRRKQDFGYCLQMDVQGDESAGVRGGTSNEGQFPIQRCGYLTTRA